MLSQKKIFKVASSNIDLTTLWLQKSITNNQNNLKKINYPSMITKINTQ